jgi:hypothetical protein
MGEACGLGSQPADRAVVNGKEVRKTMVNRTGIELDQRRTTRGKSPSADVFASPWDHTQAASGSISRGSLTAHRNRCLHPTWPSVIWIETCPRKIG